MDDTRVTFDLEKENLQKLAAEVGQTSCVYYGLLGPHACTRMLVRTIFILAPWEDPLGKTVVRIYVTSGV